MKISELITPMYDKVIVKAEKEVTEPGGFVVPEHLKDKPRSAIVVAVGPGTGGVKMQTEVDDRILFRRDAGVPTQIEGEDYLVLRDNPDAFDILAVYKSQNK